MPIINVVAAVQMTEALKLLTGNANDLHNSLMQFDVWRNEWRRSIRVDQEPIVKLAVSSLVQNPRTNSRGFRRGVVWTQCRADFSGVADSIDFPKLAERLRNAGDVKFNDYLLRFRTGDYELTVFQDARSIIQWH